MKLNGKLRTIRRKEPKSHPALERGKRGTVQHQRLVRLGASLVWALDTDTPAC